MKKGLLTLVFVSTIILLLSCGKKETTTYLGVPVNEIQSQLDLLLQNFYPRIVDTVNGGYWTNFENDWTLSEDQDKMLVTQSRGLWTAARAAELYPENPVFREAADHGYQFLVRQLWDTLNGGFCQNYYSDSVTKTDPTTKLAYSNAFALYGLSQYAKINKDPEVLNWVRKSFNWFESELHDSVYGGYYNTSFSDNKKSLPSSNNPTRWLGKPDWKDQNTSIHLMEAFTAAYQVLPEETVKERLSEMLVLIRDSMTNEEGYLNLYFTSQWQPITLKDSSKEYIIKNPWFDHISFGHNIETAYLLVDASQTLYSRVDSTTLNIAGKLIDHTMDHGFDRDFNGLFDKGYRYKDSNEVEVIDSIKVWWAQAEAWHALALFAGLRPEDPEYRDAFVSMWKYITTSVIDNRYGGWYNSGIDRNPETVAQRKAHAWKGCYHDGRALMQVMMYAGKPESVSVK
jgi:mannobiose 2-epimerase